jgi:hypothetical protein
MMNETEIFERSRATFPFCYETFFPGFILINYGLITPGKGTDF